MNERILVVDDHKEIVRLVRAYLEQAGYEVLVAYDGLTAMVATGLAIGYAVDLLAPATLAGIAAGFVVVVVMVGREQQDVEGGRGVWRP